MKWARGWCGVELTYDPASATNIYERAAPAYSSYRWFSSIECCASVVSMTPDLIIFMVG
jgi:hypothetical protein